MSAADNDMRCNNLKCRTLVGQHGKGVVTTCSLPCANQLFSRNQICPACDNQLSEPDDIVVACLNPSTDYKSASLTPSLILEIAARGMSFWTYQTSQERSFQTLVLKNAQTRLAQLEQQVNTGELVSFYYDHQMLTLTSQWGIAE
ncbi:hypothetical protein TREMEDRAFT_30699 [Tremella mesenterica DSM 1558]|uniref:uncharacterized protein n=1 Tax=Tremella mesenterica (strain ATCC 24925 / CBS 8224 / DSM 1558 / NBRC 9311 / NRRL Y-6157 / RJB 2259-6 / UBC 559-6) TaxID=578456 RepID=UPI0003F491E0|nr:uncharacterized protein TREMEDRAFT_30699 [Tremella mesenterica DSM 1558]EIW69476.1 hypothetical protein TREMEDRAFT_30699 [Tremella mesenterica DSM 1558]